MLEERDISIFSRVKRKKKAPLDSFSLGFSSGKVTTSSINPLGYNLHHNILEEKFPRLDSLVHLTCGPEDSASHSHEQKHHQPPMRALSAKATFLLLRSPFQEVWEEGRGTQQEKKGRQKKAGIPHCASSTTIYSDPPTDSTYLPTYYKKGRNNLWNTS